jgi:hypothetical protein
MIIDSNILTEDQIKICLEHLINQNAKYSMDDE